MTYRHAMIALAAAGALGVAACQSDNTGPASAGPPSPGPATAGAPNAAPQGSNTSGKPVNPNAGPESRPAAPQ